MPKTIDQHLLVLDSGLFTHIAVALAPRFAKTTYYSEWRRSGFPKGQDALIGAGLDGIERPLDLDVALADADLVVLPDVVTADDAERIYRSGKPVFGARADAAELELGRWELRKVLRRLDLPLTDAARITGTTDLRKYLEDKDDLYVKHGRYRGDLETHRHKSWALSEEWFHDLNHRLGPRRNTAEFVAEEAIDGVELAIDDYTVDGAYPSLALYGYEDKDAAYFGRVVKRDEAPPALLRVYEAFAPVFEKHEYRGWIALETRIGKDGEPYVIDPCVRAGSPPSEAQCRLWGNLAEIVSEGANGKLVEPECSGNYVAELLLKAEHATQSFVALDVPDEVRDRVMLHNHYRLDGRDYVVPIGIPNIGAVVGVGKTEEAAKRECIEAAEAIDGEGLEYDVSAFDRIAETIAKGRKYGVDWS